MGWKCHFGTLYKMCVDMQGICLSETSTWAAIQVAIKSCRIYGGDVIERIWPCGDEE